MKDMLFYKNLFLKSNNNVLEDLINAKYLCFDTETCCHTEKIYNDYFIKKIISNESGIHARVYAWALSNTSNDIVIYGHNLDEFIDCLEMITKYIFRNLNDDGYTKIKDYKIAKQQAKFEIGVHNLKYDAEFLNYGLIENEYKYYNSVVADDKIVGRTIDYNCFNIVENGNTVYSMDIFTSMKKVTMKKRSGEIKEENIINN